MFYTSIGIISFFLFLIVLSIVIALPTIVIASNSCCSYLNYFEFWLHQYYFRRLYCEINLEFFNELNKKFTHEKVKLTFKQKLHICKKKLTTLSLSHLLSLCFIFSFCHSISLSYLLFQTFSFFLLFFSPFFKYTLSLSSLSLQMLRILYLLPFYLFNNLCTSF